MTIQGKPTEHCVGCVKINDQNLCIVYKHPEEYMRWVKDPSSKKKCGFNYANLFRRGLVYDRRQTVRLKRA